MDDMGLDTGNWLSTALEQVWSQVSTVLQYPVLSSQRIYILYLVMALVFALFVFSRSGNNGKQDAPRAPAQFFKFLFPASVWKNPSAWLDVRYFFFHNIIWISLFGSLGIAITDWTVSATASALLAQSGGTPIFTTESYFLGGIIYMVILIALIDFVAFGIHYLQHKIPFLWAFHKVHHSATVMHPLTNYREHPVDNVLYIVGTGLFTGALAGSSIFLFGGVFSPPTILGISLLAFAFNFLAYNLRHSHVWLRWPGKLNFVFGCPAHHQVHHSYHPDHIDRNFAFMFPVWDLLFGTYCLPETNKDVKFGLGTGEEQDFRSCLGLYFLPFKKLWISRGRKSAGPHITGR